MFTRNNHDNNDYHDKHDNHKNHDNHDKHDNHDNQDNHENNRNHDNQKLGLGLVILKCPIFDLTTRMLFFKIDIYIFTVLDPI